MPEKKARPKPIKLVACLGNPGEEYAHTRHNAGFMVADELAQRHGATYWKSECGAATTKIKLRVPVSKGEESSPNVLASFGATESTEDVLAAKGAAAECPPLESVTPSAAAECLTRDSSPSPTAYEEREIVLAKPLSFMNTSGGPVSKLCALYDVAPEELLVIHDELDIPAGDVRSKFGGGHAGHNGLKSIMEKLGGSRDFSRVRVGIGRPPGRMDPADFVLKELRGEDEQDFACTVQSAADAAEAYILHGITK